MGTFSIFVINKV
ncbi:TPA: erythromycin resistance leader peptide, partial [Staphylococcus aureus]|nr:erythromycin resistance leader peptide [Staphylococcus aureus]HCD1718376.1 erythromycin resistance leader peptide [Enterococcus faecium]HCD7441995.1 erythromycin resistance leader peptide [Enterococcus faecium]HDE9694928.1 erythromycin resistance leader peptide [Staphylococcus aureus]HDJ1269278.1 erythromycin resistance leader peptide [Staphylococcus aureus]